MAAVTKFSALIPIPGKGINSLTFDTQFDSGPATTTTLTSSNDVITTTLDAAIGAVLGYEAVGFNILANQTVDTAAGDDRLVVTQGLAVGAVGVRIASNATLNLGDGIDRLLVTLTGRGSVGLSNQGRLLTGAGGDTVSLDAVQNGLVNNSRIDTGIGEDRIGATSLTGHALINTGTINLGLATENDRDTITGGSAGHFGLALAYTPTRLGIFNSGTITLGGGKDVVDAGVGGFGGGGTYNLGWTVRNAAGQITSQDTDADAVVGFGAGTFNGGGGRNSITLPDGTYKIAYTVKPLAATDLSSGAITRNGDLTTVMTFNQFDTVGGSGLTAGLHFLSVTPLGAAQVLDSFTVNTAGDITAVTFV